MTVALAVSASVLLTAGLTMLKLAELKRLRTSLVAYELRFPRALEADAVQVLLAGISGLLQPWWRRWRLTPFVIFEVSATVNGVEHRVLVPDTWSAILENLLQASLPGVRYEQLASLPAASVSHGVAYRLNTSQRALRVDAEALSTRLLSSLQPLGPMESLTVQWLVAPAAPVSPPRISKDAQPWPFSSGSPVSDSEAAAALKQKQAHPLMLGVVRVGCRSRSVKRSRQLLRQVEVSWHGSRAPGVHLQRKVVGERVVARQINRRSVPLASWAGSFNAAELAGLLGLPIGASSVPGLVLGGCKQLAASPRIGRTGTVIAESTFPGNERPLALDEQARLRHVHVVGPTGTGKSTLLINMVVQDLEAGRGVVLLDPKGDLATDVLARVPKSRRADVIVLDPADELRPVGLNPLRAANGASAEVVVENLVGLFKSLYRSSWGPRTDDVLRAALMTLAAAGDTTLCEVPLLLTDPTYRRRMVGRLDDPVGLESFWGWYEGLSDGERLTVVGPVLNKVRAFSMRPRIRSIIGQANPELDLRDVLAEGKVLIVSLASGLLGEEAAALLGALVIAELWHATTARAGLPSDQRKPVMAYLDEWQHFLHLPTPMASVLAEARGLGLGMTLAHQHLGQLPDAARDAVLSNARSRVIFQLPAGDARLLTRELGGLLTADDLQGLGAFEVVTQLFAAGSTQPAATGQTRPASSTCSDPALIRDVSRQQFGVDQAEVEQAIRSRQTNGRPTDRVGRVHDGGAL
jgi:hypothetical protein